MPRLLILILALATALSAAEGKGRHPKLGDVLGRQVVDAGHILEACAVSGASGHVFIHWGDLDKVVAKGGGAPFDWTGSASGNQVALVRIVAFEAGKTDGKKAGDKITGDGYAGSVAWNARTTSATDGVVVRATPGSTLQIQAGPAALSITVP